MRIRNRRDVGGQNRRLMACCSSPILFQVPKKWLVFLPSPCSCIRHHHHLGLFSPNSLIHSYSKRVQVISVLPSSSNHDGQSSQSRRFRLHGSAPPCQRLRAAAGNGRDLALERGGDEEAAAREAVSEIVEEFGVSREESVEIALKSPRYVRMLMDSVRELDELSLLWPPGSSSIPTYHTYKKKVYEVGINKGDKGMLPLLESVGLSLPSAMNVARYLSSLTLPSLLHQVKCVKQLFFSHSNERTSTIGNNARRIMVHLSVPVDEHVQQTLSFLEKLQARRGGLDLLTSGDASFQYLIESFPRLLLVPIESHVNQLVDFLQDTGVPKGCIRYIFMLFPPIVFYDIEKDIKVRMKAFKKVYGVDNEFGRILLKYPWILSEGIQENYKEILAFFKVEKVTDVNVHRAIKSCPLLLGCSIGKMKLMIDHFRELGVSDNMLGQIIATSPQLLMQKPHEFHQVVSFFKDLGLDEASIGRILGRCPEIFVTSIDRTLKKKVEFLFHVGVSKEHLPRVIRKYPELFVCDIDKALLPRMQYLSRMGLSRKEIVFMVRRFSPLLGYSIKGVLRPKYEFLVNTMHKSIGEVVEYPRYFSYSLEKKIKPRYLELKERKFECSLKDMLGKNDDEFAEFIPRQ